MHKDINKFPKFFHNRAIVVHLIFSYTVYRWIFPQMNVQKEKLHIEGKCPSLWLFFKGTKQANGGKF